MEMIPRSGVGGISKVSPSSLLKIWFKRIHNNIMFLKNIRANISKQQVKMHCISKWLTVNLSSTQSIPIAERPACVKQSIRRQSKGRVSSHQRFFTVQQRFSISSLILYLPTPILIFHILYHKIDFQYVGDNCVLILF